MIYKMDNGKSVKIDDKILKNMMSVLGLTKNEAIQTYLEDEGYLKNEEQNALTEKASTMTKVHDASRKNPKTRKKPEIKVSDEKKFIFDLILTSLRENDEILAENVTVLKENKLIQVQINDKIIKLDLIQQRPPKK
jgi:hypothetical protein